MTQRDALFQASHWSAWPLAMTREGPDDSYPKATGGTSDEP
jgi:hypothetical protein